MVDSRGACRLFGLNQVSCYDYGGVDWENGRFELAA